MMLNNMKQVVSLLLLQLLTADLVYAGNRPGSGGGCDGEAPRPRPRPNVNGNAGGGNPNAGGGNPNGENRRMTFSRDIAGPATRRALQGNAFGDGARPLDLNEEDIAICCTGNGDFGFLQRDLDIKPGGLSEATEAEGFKKIPGDSLWSCRRLCREVDDGDLDVCYAACNCRQDCPTSIDFLTVECRSTCRFPPETFEDEVCLETCDFQCGERCRSTFNGYIVPLDIYAEGLEILDCKYGDLIGDSEASCNTGEAYWESIGYACEITDEAKLDCQCINPGTCPNDVYPCFYEFHCTSNAPTDTPSAMPTPAPTPRPTKGKAGKAIDENGNRIPKKRNRNRQYRQ